MVLHEKKNKRFIRRFHVKSVWIREAMAEFMGTFVLVLFGDAVVAQVVLSESFGTPKGDFFSINWGWAMGVCLGILVSGGVSGAHLNPAVTVALAAVDKFPWWKMFHYIAAQYLGAFAGSALVFAVYYDAFRDYRRIHGWDETSAGIFATYPSTHLTLGGGAFDQVVGTALLLFVILAVVDHKNMKVKLHLVPLYVGFAILNIGICFGWNCGYAVNPARDLAPRIFTAIAGWGGDVFVWGNYFFWVPVIASHVGGIIGALLYTLLIENHWPTDEELEMAGMKEEDEYKFRHLKKDLPGVDVQLVVVEDAESNVVRRRIED